MNNLNRLNQILINDKYFDPTRFNELLEIEVYKVLSHYMDITREQISTKVEVDVEGNYVFKCKAKCNRLKVVGLLK